MSTPTRRARFTRPRALLVALFAALAQGCSAGGGVCTTPSECSPGESCAMGRCRSAADAGGLDVTGMDAPVEPGDTFNRDVRALDSGPPPGAGCTGDLRSVLGAMGEVLYACPPEQGCRAGGCVPACEAAGASHGSVGCDFFAPTPPAYPPALPPCHAVFLANAWPRSARVTVTRGARSFDATTFARIVDNARPTTDWAPVPAAGIPEGAVAVLFLSSDPNSVMPDNGVPLNCPVPPAIDASTMLEGSGTADAFRVSTDVPVSAYDIMPYGGARSHFPSAQLLLPTSALGNGYVLITAPPGTAGAPGPQWVQIYALEDATTVRVRPTADLPEGGRLPAIARGAEGSVTLSAGQYLQWQLPADPSGTLIASDRPVGVTAGNRFLRLQPVPASGGESTHQQNLPVDALGNVYVAAPYETRRADLAAEPIPYRLVGAVDGTVLTFEPRVRGAPATLQRGEVADIVSDEPFVVSSQDAMHPFAAAQLMTTANVPGMSRPGAVAPGFGPWLGDEEFVVMFPPAQFLSSYVFFTDPAYPTTNLAIVRVSTARGFSPVTVDCLGEVTGFRPVGAGGRWEVATVDLVRAGVGVRGCTNGRHTARSDAPFGIVVWGLDSYSSYAYPAGGNAATLVDLPPPL